jgi:hypothetical protein
MSGLFVCYRWDDARGDAGRLVDDLKEKLHGVRVFRDINETPIGADYRYVIGQELPRCAALIVLIGPRWLSPRLQNRDDTLRNEIASALYRQIPVLPVLVGDGKLPSADELPDDLKPLAYRFAHELSDTRWEQDMAKLCAALETLPGLRAQPVAVAGSQAAHKHAGLVLALVGILGFMGLVVLAVVVGLLERETPPAVVACPLPATAAGLWQPVGQDWALLITQAGNQLDVRQVRGGQEIGRGAGALCGMNLVARFETPGVGITDLQMQVGVDALTGTLALNGAVMQAAFARARPGQARSAGEDAAQAAALGHRMSTPALAP